MQERAPKGTHVTELPRYRVLTGVDDEVFCRRVSEALALGYELYQGPAMTYDGEHVVVAQAVVWSKSGATPPG
jgi:hypothetical protein